VAPENKTGEGSVGAWCGEGVEEANLHLAFALDLDRTPKLDITCTHTNLTLIPAPLHRQIHAHANAHMCRVLQAPVLGLSLQHESLVDGGQGREALGQGARECDGVGVGDGAHARGGLDGSSSPKSRYLGHARPAMPAAAAANTTTANTTNTNTNTNTTNTNTSRQPTQAARLLASSCKQSSTCQLG